MSERDTRHHARRNTDSGLSVRRNLFRALSARLDSLVHSLRICAACVYVRARVRACARVCLAFREASRSLRSVSCCYTAQRKARQRRVSSTSSRARSCVSFEYERRSTGLVFRSPRTYLFAQSLLPASAAAGLNKTSVKDAVASRGMSKLKLKDNNNEGA